MRAPNEEANESVRTTSTITQVQSELGRRLVEYFVVLSTIERKPGDKIDKNNSNDLSFSEWKTESSDHDDKRFKSIQFRPTVTARYPLLGTFVKLGASLFDFKISCRTL